MEGLRIVESGVSPRVFVRLWDDYVQAAKRYELAKQAVDRAEAVCSTAHFACDVAYAEEVLSGSAVMRVSAALEAASDAAFLEEHGISHEVTDQPS